MPVGPAYLAPDYTDNILSGLNGSPDNFAGNDHSLCNYSDTAPFYVEFPWHHTGRRIPRACDRGRSKATRLWLTRRST